MIEPECITNNELVQYMNLPALSECVYTANYCEENVWKICERVIRCPEKYPHESFAVFVTNDIKKVVFWNHKISGRHRYVAWDYHVIFIHGNKQKGYVVLDADSLLAFPVAVNRYCMFTFDMDRIINEGGIKPETVRKFRIVTAKEFVENFSSDRRHMRMDGDNQWLSKPPSYAPIKAACVDYNLDDFLSMDPNIGYGKLVDYDTFKEIFKHEEE